MSVKALPPELKYAIFMQDGSGREIYNFKKKKEYFGSIAVYILENEPPHLEKTLDRSRITKAKEILADCSSKTQELALQAMKTMHEKYVDLLLCSRGDFVIKSEENKRDQVGLEPRQCIEEALRGTSLISEGIILENDKVAASFFLLSFTEEDLEFVGQEDQEPIGHWEFCSPEDPDNVEVGSDWEFCSPEEEKKEIPK